MGKYNKKIVIFGGAFNPPHIGHAAAIETVIRLFLCDEIWVMPSANRRDKEVGTAGEHRLAMLEIMIKELFPASAIPILTSSLEVDRSKLTATYETKLELERAYPNTDFYFMIGSDVVGVMCTHIWRFSLEWENGYTYGKNN